MLAWGNQTWAQHKGHTSFAITSSTVILPLMREPGFAWQLITHLQPTIGNIRAWQQWTLWQKYRLTIRLRPYNNIYVSILFQRTTFKSIHSSQIYLNKWKKMAKWIQSAFLLLGMAFQYWWVSWYQQKVLDVVWDGIKEWLVPIP